MSENEVIKKKKKRKDEDRDVDIVKKKKKDKKRKAECLAGPEVDNDNSEITDGELTSVKNLAGIITGTEVDTEPPDPTSGLDDGELKQYDKQLKNKLPTRQERLRRDNQRKMQVFVAEMRAQGKTKKEIDRLKKKVKAKLKFIQPNQDFSSMVALSDIQLSCRECHADFIFSVQEQRFYQEKQYQPPVRCKDCTAAKKVRMASFDKKDAWDGGVSNMGKGGGVRSNWGNI